MPRGVLIFALIVVATVAAWNHLIVRDGLMAELDKRPKLGGGDFVLYSMGSAYEVFNNDQKALAFYGRVVSRYPKSSYADSSQFGCASALERLRRYPEARAEYEKYAEAFPKGRYIRTVLNNIEIMKGR